jgi:hypothetical protein
MISKDRCPDCAYPVSALSIVYFSNPATKVQDQACRSSLSQTNLENALEAHRERDYREELMASWCAIDGGGLWRAKFHVADAAQVAAPRDGTRARDQPYAPRPKRGRLSLCLPPWSVQS